MQREREREREGFTIIESRWPSGNTLASDASGPGSTPGNGILKIDTGYHHLGVCEMCSNQ